MHFATFPYYRFFQFNTLGPILRIAACTSQPIRFEKLSHLVVRWQSRKLAELQFTSIAVRYSTNPFPFRPVSLRLSFQEARTKIPHKFDVCCNLSAPFFLPPSSVRFPGPPSPTRTGCPPHSGTVASCSRYWGSCFRPSRLPCSTYWEHVIPSTTPVLREQIFDVLFR